MQNSPTLDFRKILDQSLYTHMTEKMTKQEEVNKKVNSRIPENEKTTLKLGLVNRLKPVVEYIAIGEVVVGSVMIIFLMFFASDYDKLYATESSGRILFGCVFYNIVILLSVISLMSFGASFFLIVSGVMLLTSLKLDLRKVMWLYILKSTLLWIYIFVMSVMEIHFALLVIERDTNKVILPESRHLLLSNACAAGIATMLGSVVHFIGNVTVFTYYNLKYIQLTLFNCGP